MHVVAPEPVRLRRLGRNRFQSGVGIDHSGGREKALVGETPKAGPSIVVRHVLDQPIDRIVRIGALVGVAARALVSPERTHLNEHAVGPVASANGSG